MKVLTAIPGIGKYSAAIIFGQSVPPIDAWSVVIMSELYKGTTPENSRDAIERVLRELSARWGAWSLARVCVPYSMTSTGLQRYTRSPGSGNGNPGSMRQDIKNSRTAAGSVSPYTTDQGIRTDCPDRHYRLFFCPTRIARTAIRKAESIPDTKPNSWSRSNLLKKSLLPSPA